MTNIDALVGARFPLRNAIVVGQILLKDVNWTAKDTKVREMMRWHLAGEQFVRSFVVTVSYWSHVVEPNSMFDHKCPNVSCDDLGP